MIHHSYKPTGLLSQFVDFIWVAKADSIALSSSHYAPLFTELIFSYAGKFDVVGQNIETERGNGTKRILSGLKTTPFTTTVSGPHACVGLILKPFCYGFLIRQFNTALLDRLSDCLYDYLLVPEKPCFQATKMYLLELFAKKELDADLSNFEEYISTEILQKGALRQFSESLSISQKGFIQKFKRHYLLTPSQYAKLKQVHVARQLMSAAPGQQVLHAGLDAGFYDQAHFTRVFKQFCGQTPKQFQLQSAG